MHLLLVEDDFAIATNLKFLLEEEHYFVDLALTEQEAIEKISSTLYDFFILDISLPDGDGFSLFSHFICPLKKPTIFLTAKEEEESIVKGLLLGAEDYITKPFSSRELIVRIQKIIARQQKSNVIKIKDIQVDLDKMEVCKKGEKIALTSLELKILFLLINNINKVVTRDSILEHIWEWTGNDVNDNTVTVYLKRIREKLGSDIVITIKGIGYRVDADEK